MNIHRKIRCGVCGATASHKRTDRDKGKTPLWTSRGEMVPPLRNFARLPNRIDRCASCAIKAVEATREQDARRLSEQVARRERRDARKRRAQRVSA